MTLRELSLFTGYAGMTCPPHFWLLDDQDRPSCHQGRRGHWGLCKLCEAQRFFPSWDPEEGWHAFQKVKTTQAYHASRTKQLREMAELERQAMRETGSFTPDPVRQA